MHIAGIFFLLIYQKIGSGRHVIFYLEHLCYRLYEILFHLMEKGYRMVKGKGDEIE